MSDEDEQAKRVKSLKTRTTCKTRTQTLRGGLVQHQEDQGKRVKSLKRRTTCKTRTQTLREGLV